MGEPFQGTLSFNTYSDGPASAEAALAVMTWKINAHNGPYLAGRAPEPSHEIARLDARQSQAVELSEAEVRAIIGDISQAVAEGAGFIVAATSDFKEAEAMARKLGYRPARAGEFLQLLWWFWQNKDYHPGWFGWFFCYAGRTPKYAIIAEYNTHCSEAPSVKFDTHVGTSVEDGCMSENMSTHCFFVQEQAATLGE